MASSLSLSNEETLKVVGPRNRSGGVFIKLDNVILHPNDFSFEEIFEKMNLEEKAHVQEYLERCYELLDLIDIFNYTGESPSHNWNNHYNSSKNHFPLKNYLIHAFPVLKTYITGESKSVVLECGCGTGSSLLPLLFNFPSSNCIYVGFDISVHALNHFKKNPLASSLISQQKLFLFQYDIVGLLLPDEHEAKKIKMEKSATELYMRSFLDKNFTELKGIESDVVLLIFVLSSLPSLNAMGLCLRRLWNVMKPRSILLFRDYGLGDHNFFRYISRDQGTVNELGFRKADGTTQMFFEKDFVTALFLKCGFECYEGYGATYHCNHIHNRKNGKSMNKIFVNGIFQRKE